MTTQEATALSDEIRGLVEHLEKAANDPSEARKISTDPLGTLRSHNIEVEDKFRSAVVSQLQALTATVSHDAHRSQMETMSAKSQEFFAVAAAESEALSRPAAPTGLRVESGEQTNTTPPEVLSALEFMVKPWGFVVAVREPAIKYLQGGGEIAGGAAGGISAIAGLGGLAAAGSVLGPLGIGVALIAGLIAAALAIYSGLIAIVNRGNGVYLTWTWAQVLPVLNLGHLPLVTPI